MKNTNESYSKISDYRRFIKLNWSRLLKKKKKKSLKSFPSKIMPKKGANGGKLANIKFLTRFLLKVNKVQFGHGRFNGSE